MARPKSKRSDTQHTFNITQHHPTNAPEVTMTPFASARRGNTKRDGGRVAQSTHASPSQAGGSKRKAVITTPSSLLVANDESHPENQREVGSRVFCKWNNNEWYWGTIEKKTHRGKAILYAVKFDDGDYLDGMMQHHVCTVQSYRRVYGKAPPPRHYAQQRNNKKTKRDKSRNYSALIGLGTLQQWTDVEGRTKIVYGTVQGLEYSTSDDEEEDSKDVVVIEYDKESLYHVNSVANVCGTSVPETGKISYELAAGACLSFATLMGEPVPKKIATKSSWMWLTPQFRTEKMVQVGIVELPRLTLTFRGYHLEFNVKESTIPDAGYGVFVKATPVLSLGGMSNNNKFVLEAGELLDLGVYAPFCKEDKKETCVYFLKNYIHSFKCEEWTFEAKQEDYELDITDDVTGDVHELARCHIPSYVNECGGGTEQVATIRAESDPEGNVHYLLGIVTGNKELCIPADGTTETEIFVDYGPRYEPVRIRKGYSHLDKKAKAQMLREMKHDEEEFLGAIASSDVDEIGACTEFLHGLFTKDGFPEKYAAGLFGAKAGERALRVAEVFHQTLTTLKHSGETVPLGLEQSVMSLVSLLSKFFGKESK